MDLSNICCLIMRILSRIKLTYNYSMYLFQRIHVHRLVIAIILASSRIFKDLAVQVLLLKIGSLQLIFYY